MWLCCVLLVSNVWRLIAIACCCLVSGVNNDFSNHRVHIDHCYVQLLRRNELYDNDVNESYFFGCIWAWIFVFTPKIKYYNPSICQRDFSFPVSAMSTYHNTKLYILVYTVEMSLVKLLALIRSYSTQPTQCIMTTTESNCNTVPTKGFNIILHSDKSYQINLHNFNICLFYSSSSKGLPSISNIKLKNYFYFNKLYNLYPSELQ